jgi:hypothetical protein
MAGPNHLYTGEYTLFGLWCQLQQLPQEVLTMVVPAVTAARKHTQKQGTQGQQLQQLCTSQHGTWWLGCCGKKEMLPMQLPSHCRAQAGRWGCASRRLRRRDCWCGMG